MQFRAVLGNARRPEYGFATIPFPIKNGDYDNTMELLEPLEIGGVMKRDCYVQEIISDYLILKRLEKVAVDIDELDYLAKRLDSFTDDEAAAFEGMASKLGLFDVRDLINLTFCCQEATVITDFTDLDAVGRSHYLTINGGSSSMDELSKVDGRSVALALINGEAGHITPFGVVYDNGMQLRQLYDGRHFPSYLYEPCVMELEIRSRHVPADSPGDYLYLPMSQTQIERTMLRAGIDNYGEMSLRFMGNELPEEIDAALDMDHENLTALNEMCEAISRLSPADRMKLAAAVSLAKPEYSSQIKELAEQLDLFDFVPGAQTPADYDRYMITASGHYEFDENLAEYYDFGKYGKQRMEQEYGEFSARGYIAYHGTLSLDEIMFGSQGERLDFSMGEMGGMA